MTQQIVTQDFSGSTHTCGGAPPSAGPWIDGFSDTTADEEVLAEVNTWRGEGKARAGPYS